MQLKPDKFFPGRYALIRPYMNSGNIFPEFRTVEWRLSKQSWINKGVTPHADFTPFPSKALSLSRPPQVGEKFSPKLGGNPWPAFFRLMKVVFSLSSS